MTAILISVLVTGIAANQSIGSGGSFGAWAFFQVFVAFCLTVAGLMWLSRHKI